MATTIVLCIFLSVFLTTCFVAAVLVFDISLEEKKEPVGTILVNGREWEIYQDTLPLYVEDFAEAKDNSSSRATTEKTSFLAEYGEYQEYLFEGEVNSSITVANRYEVITAKAEFLYDFLLEDFYRREFRNWDDVEREKTEYRAVYECEAGTMYRQYYEGLPMAHDWLVLTRNKIVPMTLYLEDLTEEQMKIIVEAFGNE